MYSDWRVRKVRYAFVFERTAGPGSRRVRGRGVHNRFDRAALCQPSLGPALAPAVTSHQGGYPAVRSEHPVPQVSTLLPSSRTMWHLSTSDMGQKNGLNAACGNCLKGPPEKTIFFVPGGLWRDQDHTTTKITFKDGSVFYIDCSTISSLNINNLTGGSSHIGLPKQIPPSWEVYPRQPYKPPTPPQPNLDHPIPYYRFPPGVVPLGR